MNNATCIPVHAFSARSQQGMSLVELMVAVTVFSIGILAVANLQISGIRHTQMAALRVEATLAAHAMIEEMRANRLARTDHSFPYQSYAAEDDPTSISASTTCYQDNSDCSSDEIANLSLKRWLEGLADNLPEGRGIVCQDNSPGDATESDWGCSRPSSRYVVKVGWREQNPPGSNERRSWQFVEVEVEIDAL